MSTKEKVLLVILDGWGLSCSEKGNAPLEAKTPTLDYIYATYPKTSIAAAGLEVGLNPGEPGNSEVGHLNLGSGRVVWEDLPRINQAIESGGFYENKVLLAAVEHAKKHDSTLHLWGLVSDGGIHSHIRHLVALLELASKNKLNKVLIHFIGDGRDTAPEEAERFVDEAEKAIKKYRVGRIATVVGRFFAMDRDKNWDRVQKAYDLITKNAGAGFNSVKDALQHTYKQGKTDEYIEPAVIGEGGAIEENDAVIMFNYRSDRARQMQELLTGSSSSQPFEHAVPKNLFVATMTRYKRDQKAPEAFPKVNLTGTLAEIIAASGKTQFHIAETEKYAHVTFFFDGGREKPNTGEKHFIVPSKKVISYVEAPEMSAKEISRELIGAFQNDYDFILVNYANGDMVGHTGDLKAAIAACSAVDTELGQVLAKAGEAGYRVVITADHGNCETMVDESTGKPNPEHTTNPVPFIHLDFQKTPFNPGESNFSKDDYNQFASSTPVGILADVAPSVLSLLGIKLPKDMAGMDLTVAL